MQETAGSVGALIRRAKQSDREAFGEIYRQTVAAVYRYLSARVNTVHEAEELTQEVFMAALGGLVGLRAEDEPALLAWLFKIARHKLADHLRQRYRHPASNLEDAEEVVSQQAGPEVVAEKAEARAAVREALELLTPEQREVLVYKYVMDYDNALTARLVGRNANSVNQLHHRALASLHRLMSARQKSEGSL